MHVPKLDGADGLRCRCEYTGVMPRADATVIGAVQCPEAEEFAANLRAVHLRDGIPPKGGLHMGGEELARGAPPVLSLLHGCQLPCQLGRRKPAGKCRW